jgi:hypothetical protein
MSPSPNTYRGRRARSILLPTVAVLLVGITTTVEASATQCSRVRVASGGELLPRWRQAVKSLESEVAKLGGDDCSDATIIVLHEGAVVRLEVTTPDGRHAQRVVSVPSELGAVTLGLLASIPVEPSIEEPPITITESTSSVYEPPPPERDRERERAVNRSPGADRPANLGLMAGTRASFPTGVVAPEFELRGDVRFGGWVVSLSGRGSPAGTLTFRSGQGGYEYTEFSFGVLGGKRFSSVTNGVLTLTLGPRVGIVTEETETLSRTHKDLWVQASVRYIVPVGDRWRPAIGLELDAAPNRLADVSRESGLPPFPSWSASLRVGIAGDVP